MFRAEQIPATWRSWWQSFARSLKAENASDATIESYGQAVRQLAEFVTDSRNIAPPLLRNSVTPGPLTVTRDQCEAFVADLLARWRPATAAARWKGLKRFYGWLEEEGEIAVNPMAKVKPPRVPEQPPEVLTLEAVGKLLKACGGRSFADRRDCALLRFAFDTGCRRAEVIGLAIADVDLDEQTARVTGKGGRQRLVAFGRKTARDLDRYLRLRGHHRYAELPALWLGERGPLAPHTFNTILKQRSAQAGLDQRTFPHLFRHSFAHSWLAGGGQEGDLMQLAGWRSRRMLEKYGASRAAERARLAHRLLSPGDQI